MSTAISVKVSGLTLYTHTFDELMCILSDYVNDCISIVRVMSSGISKVTFVDVHSLDGFIVLKDSYTEAVIDANSFFIC